MTHEDDEQLFTLIKEGDKKAFDVFFLKYYSFLCLYSKQFVEEEQGKEIVQDLMLWIWLNREHIVVENSLKGYLLTSVRNKCLSYLSRKKTEYKIMQIMQESALQIWEEVDLYHIQELQKKITEEIKNLPEQYREAFILNRYYKMTYNEIAKRLRVSPKTIDYRIQQALKILRSRLKKYL